MRRRDLETIKIELTLRIRRGKLTNSYQFGWDSLSAYSGYSKRTLINQKSELKKAGVVEIILKGFPPRKVLRWKPEMYDRYLNKKNKKS